MATVAKGPNDVGRIASWRLGVFASIAFPSVVTGNEAARTFLMVELRISCHMVRGISVYTLAENMGTSVAMIEKYYGHVRPERAADELTKE